VTEFADSPEDAAFRAEVRAWLEAYAVPRPRRDAPPPPFSAHLEETPSRGLTNKSISQLPDMAVFGSGGRRENCANPKPGKELEKRQRGEVPGIG